MQSKTQIPTEKPKSKAEVNARPDAAMWALDYQGPGKRSLQSKELHLELRHNFQ